jgi:hypothetical protein
MNQNYMVCVLSHSLHFLIDNSRLALDFIFDLGVISEFGDRTHGERSDAFISLHFHCVRVVEIGVTINNSNQVTRSQRI